MICQVCLDYTNFNFPRCIICNCVTHYHCVSGFTDQWICDLCWKGDEL